MSARGEIENLLHRVSWGYDEGDVDLIAASFAGDARMSMRIGDRGGDLVGSWEGREAIRALHADSLAAQSDQRRHVVSNLVVESETGDAASVVSYLTLVAVAGGKAAVLSTGWYRDQLVRTSDGWLIRDRYLYLDLPY